MSKRLLTVITFLLLFFWHATHAQDNTTHPHIKLGIEAGPDFPRILDVLQVIQAYSAFGTLNQNSKSVTRFYGGFFADIPLDKKAQFILRPHLRYLGAGGQTPLILYDSTEFAPKTNYVLDYIDLPLQLLYSPSFSFGKPWIGAGFYSAVLFSANAKYNPGSQTLTIGNAASDDFKRFDFGFNATAGLTLNCGVLLGIDFQQGTSDISPETTIGYSRPKIRNSLWGVHLGYILNVSKTRSH